MVITEPATCKSPNLVPPMLIKIPIVSEICKGYSGNIFKTGNSSEALVAPITYRCRRMSSYSIESIKKQFNQTPKESKR